jgi:hypothetical protein
VKRLAAATLLGMVLLGCKSEPKGKVEIVAAPVGETVEAIVQRESARASADGRDLVIYVGAVWCEPCKYFHEAAERGELDHAFPKLRMLEFDRDRDEARLQAAGCISQLIPLFAAPTADGRCDQRLQVMGGIKGAGTVDFIAERLQRMLAAR